MKPRISYFFSVLLLFFLILNVKVAWGSNHKQRTTPLQAHSCSTPIKSHQVKELSTEQSTLILDVRFPHEYIDEHLPGAKGLWYNEKSQEDEHFDSSKDHFDWKKLLQLSANKSALIFYCNGPLCWKSFKAIHLFCSQAPKDFLQTKKIFWYRDGMADWISNQFPTKKLEEDARGILE